MSYFATSFEQLSSGHAASGLLHNMSMRPRTEVRWRIASLGGRLVRLDLAATGHTPAWVARNARELRPLLDRDWRRTALRGALLVYPPRADADSAGEPIVVRDLSLVLNVLGRASDHVLLPDAPLALEPAFLSRSLATDDPRIVALALALARRARSEDPA